MNHEGHEGHEEEQDTKKIIFLCVQALTLVTVAVQSFVPLAAEAQTAGSLDPPTQTPNRFGPCGPDLAPPELRGKTAAERGPPAGLVERAIGDSRAIAAGDDDSIINFLLYGTAFTKRARANARCQLVARPADALRPRARIGDFVAPLRARRQRSVAFARDVVRRHGIDATTAGGGAAVSRRTGALAMSAAARCGRARSIHPPLSGLTG